MGTADEIKQRIKHFEKLRDGSKCITAKKEYNRKVNYYKRMLKSVNNGKV